MCELDPHDLVRPDATMRYWTGGAVGGPMVVLLHGATLDHRAWAPQVEALQDRFRLVIPDLRAHGESTGSFDFEAAVRDVFALLDALPVGRVVLVGVPTPEMTLELPFLDIFSRGGAVKSSWYGDCLPERDFPMYTELYLQGRFPLGDFVDERVGIDAVESAFAKMKQGSVLRSVVEL